jgi:hypothetical protein
MTSHDLHHGTGWIELSPEAEDKWRRHIVVVLWLVVGLVIALSAALLWAEANGFFQSSSDQTIPSWPAADWTGPLTEDR